MIRADRADIFELKLFLKSADLTLAGVDDPNLPLWIDVDADGRIEGTAGFEAVGAHALLRSVAVAPSLRRAGRGTELARFAMDRASDAGATTAWLFSRRSGAFWENVGFEPADRDELAELLASTHQVAEFAATGQLLREIAWSRRLA